MAGSLRIDVNGAPRTVGRDQYTVPTRYGTTSGARRPDRPGRPTAGDDSPRHQPRTRSIVRAQPGYAALGAGRPRSGLRMAGQGRAHSPRMRVASGSTPVRRPAPPLAEGDRRSLIGPTQAP